MKSFKIAEKEYDFNRPTPARLATVEGMVNEFELFASIHNISTVWKDDKEKFAKFAGEWEKFCNEVFKGGFVPELALENVVYPDEVTGAATDFFFLPSEKTMERLQQSATSSKAANTKSQ
jgi:hypothetical protein